MADREYTARKIVRDGMEILRFRCEPRDWQRQLDHALERQARRERRLFLGSLGVIVPWVFVGGYFMSLVSIPLALTAGFLLPIAGVVGVADRKRWYPSREGPEAPPEVLLTSTGVLIDSAIARPWHGAGYHLVDARVSDDVNPWMELTFRSRWRVEVYELPTPTGLLKAAMEITEMLRAKSKPIANT